MIENMESNNTLINGGYPLHTFADVEELYKTYITNENDRQKIKEAYDFMMEKHNGQLRKSGEPYCHHLIEVCYILAELRCGPSTLISGLLHDVLEDTDTQIDEIEKNWGVDVAKIVNSLTKIQRLKLSKIESEEFEAEDHRKILIGMASDIRVIIVKLADRLHNLRTLGSLSKERQLALSKESLEVFVPIAHRLGLELIKSEIADICLSYLKPNEYQNIQKLLAKKSKSLTKSLDTLKKRIADILFEHGYNFEISSRVKSIYSIYTKMYEKGKRFDELYDILALRIICDTETQCYEILGLIHKTYTPVFGRMKDYIAMPKPNMYQSLHTTIISGDGNFYEVQIRTKEMNEIAEIGVASHWAYKEGSNYNPREEQKEIENKLHWFRDFVSMSSDNQESNASEYMNNLQKDIFDANVYVFTPKGKVIELPNGSTPIDFAYRIHSKIGESITGALVNHSIVTLNTILKNGDMVEIKTNKNAPGPNERWLDFVKSATAKNYIRRYLTKKNAELERGEKIEKGKQACLDAFKERGISEEEMMTMLSEEKTLENFEVHDVNELFIAVSGRKPTAAAIIDFLKIKRPVDISFQNDKRSKTKTTKGKENPVYCKGVGGKIAINLANCCTPVPGDDIIGFITKGKGITVHRKNCPNVAGQNERLIDVYWRKDIEYATYPIDIQIEAIDRPNLLIDIATALNNAHVSVLNLHASKVDNNMRAFFTLTIEVSDAKRANDIFNILSNINSVYDVKRIIH